MLSKDTLRQKAFQKRLTVPPAYQEEAALKFKDNFLANIVLPPKGSVISAYMPFNAELNVKPLMTHLLDDGYIVVIPHVVNNDRSLDFRTWTPKMPVYRNLHGIEEADLRHSQVYLPDLMIVPLIAFDVKGNRMGYGSGQFDRTFAHLQDVRQQFTAIGVAYESQREDDVPVDAHDYPLHKIVTELNVYNCREASAT